MPPRRIDDGDFNSVIAVLFDNLNLPVPAISDQACTAAVDSPSFTAFMATQAVVLTPLTLCYLVGVDDAGDGLRPLAARRRAGMLAILRTKNVA
jgi:hypothetical protein